MNWTAIIDCITAESIYKEYKAQFLFLQMVKSGLEFLQ